MKYLIALGILCLVSAPGWGAEPTYTLTVTTDEIAILRDTLGAQPYARVAPLIAKLQAQINAQDQARAPQPPKPEDKKE